MGNVKIDALIAKARGFTISIEKMTASQRTDAPDEEYADDYNRLRSVAIDAAPDLEALMPPAVSTYLSMGERKLCNQSFGEIDTFCEQIVQLLSTIDG